MSEVTVTREELNARLDGLRDAMASLRGCKRNERENEKLILSRINMISFITRDKDIMCGHITDDLVEHYSQDIETVKEGFALYSKNAHKEMAALQAHADKLAEALRKLTNRLDNITTDGFAQGAERIEREFARNTLAAYESEAGK